MQQVRAQLNGVRLSPRKVRAVAALVKRHTVVWALDQLAHTVLRPAPVLAKLIRSASASAEHTYKASEEQLFISDIIVNEGMKLRRWLPRAQGRATELQKKTSRICVVLEIHSKAPEKEAAAKKSTRRTTRSATPAATQS
ncbi:MAG: 50S ribosomal protein L22 [Candidatus Paceibacterota bacterium]|nr:MAG: 50S ribosomal protein L22 [Candidatus Paceibacterota bacterium]